MRPFRSSPTIAGAATLGDEQDRAVARIGERVRGLGEHRARPCEQRRCGLQQRDPEIGDDRHRSAQHPVRAPFFGRSYSFARYPFR